MVRAMVIYTVSFWSLFNIFKPYKNIVKYILGGNLGSYALGDVLIATVSGAYVLSGFMFLAAAVEDESRIDVEWNKKNITWNRRKNSSFDWRKKYC
jgi:hypothetical protein